MEKLPIIIREALPSDIEHLADVERSAAQIFKDNTTLAWVADDAVQSTAIHQTYIQSKNSWVAIHDDQFIGFINGVEHNKTFHICELSVGQDWQNQGVGNALLSHVENAMRERGITALTLTTFRDIPWNAPFYERKGFVELNDNELSLFLADILEEEIESGLDPNNRCAMQKLL